MTQKRELQIYRNLLIKLHTANWTGNQKRVIEIMRAIGEYSYARTNSIECEKIEKKLREKTLLKLEQI